MRTAACGDLVAGEAGPAGGRLGAGSTGRGPPRCSDSRVDARAAWPAIWPRACSVGRVALSISPTLPVDLVGDGVAGGRPAPSCRSPDGRPLTMPYSVPLTLFVLCTTHWYSLRASCAVGGRRCTERAVPYDRLDGTRRRRRHAASASASATCGPCATSTSTSPPAPCSACSATTAPARPPPSASSPRCPRRPTGTATVAGLDVVSDAGAVPPRIGVAAQQATVDGLLDRPRQPRDGRPAPPPAEGRGPPPGRRAARAARPHRRRRPPGQDLLRRHAPPARPRRQPRRLARGAVPRRADHRPRPPQPQRPVGDAARPRRATAPPSILTTQYLEEADRLADDIVVLDHGRAVAHGTPDELKARIGNDRIDVTVADRRRARRRRRRAGAGSPSSDADVRRATCSPSRSPIARGHPPDRQSSAPSTTPGIDAVDINRRQATLDDVFLTLTAARAPTHRRRHDDQEARGMTATARSRATRPPRADGRRPLRRRCVARHDGVRPPQPRAHPPDPREAARRHRAAAHVRAAVRLRLRRRDRRRRRQLPRVPHRRHPRAVARLRHDGSGHRDRHRPRPRA